MQYDLLLTQNVHPSGVEFSEKYVNLAKGALLSGAMSGDPTVLAAGTNGYQLVRDDAEATGLKWVAITAGHTQGTDTGTTNATFDIDSDSTTGKLQLKAVANAGEDHLMILQNGAMTGDVTLTLPAVTGILATQAYADGLFAANDAMVYKGTVGTGGTIEIAALNALTTYHAGWTYRVKTSGTILGVVCEVGDLITCIVDRTGSGNVTSDWTVIQTNLDGAVIGPVLSASTDGYVALFDGDTGKLLKRGSGVLGSGAYATISDYIAKTILHANTLLYATAEHTPAELAVAEQGIVGRITGGNIVSLTAAQTMSILWQSVPATRTTAGTAGWMAKDSNFLYLCTATNLWARAPIATNW